MTTNGLIQGCLPIMRFNYGAGNLKRVQSVFRYSTILVTSLNDVWDINYHAVSKTDFEFVYGFGKNAFLWDYCNADYGSRLFVLRAFYNDSTYMQAIEKVLSSIMIQIFRQMFF